MAEGKGGKVSSGQVLSKAERYLERALHFYSQKEPDYAAALTDLDEALQLERRNPELYATRGLMLLQANQPAAAQADFRQAIKLDPSQWLVYYALGIQAFNERRYDEALQYFNAVQHYAPLRPEVFVYKAAAYYQLHEKKRALAEIESALQLITDKKSKLSKAASAWRGVIRKMR